MLERRDEVGFIPPEGRQLCVLSFQSACSRVGVSGREKKRMYNDGEGI